MATLAGHTIASTYATLIKLNGISDTLVAGASGNAIQLKTGDNDTTPLYLNTDRVGIGTDSPHQLLEVASSESPVLQIGSYDSDSNITQGILRFQRSKHNTVGTIAGGDTIDNTEIGMIDFAGVSTDDTATSVASILVRQMG